MNSEKKFLKNKNTFFRLIVLSSIAYGISAFLLLILGIIYSCFLDNGNLKNSVIAFGVISLIIYIVELTLASIVAVFSHKLVRKIRWNNFGCIDELNSYIVILIATGLGFCVYWLIINLDKKLVDISNGNINANTKLNKNVKFYMPYDRDKLESIETTLKDAESYNFDVPLTLNDSTN